ncbi:MAG: alpha/beta fold hydrolase [Candidatus Micrarchaeota archaeon]|nr:alpha/beta fold hydrolase [Candidatus Micrarchaeota archaeon]
MATIQVPRQIITVAPEVSSRELDALKRTAKDLAEEGATVLFLHGWNGSGRYPQEWVLDLERNLGDVGIQMVRPDLPNSIYPHAIDQLRVSLGIIKDLKGPVQIMCHSLGGVVGVLTAHYAPNNLMFDGITLVASPAADLWNMFPSFFYNHSLSAASIMGHTKNFTVVQPLKDYRLTRHGWSATDHANRWLDIAGGLGKAIFLPEWYKHLGHPDKIERCNYVLAALLRNHIVESLIRRNPA